MGDEGGFWGFRTLWRYWHPVNVSGQYTTRMGSSIDIHSLAIDTYSEFVEADGRTDGL